MNIEIIRNTLYKSYLEAFFNFCKDIGGETEEVMCPILAVKRKEIQRWLKGIWSKRNLLFSRHSDLLLSWYSDCSREVCLGLRQVPCASATKPISRTMHIRSGHLTSS